MKKTILRCIREADAKEIDEILNAATERRRQLFPDWEMVFFARPKQTPQEGEEEFQNYLQGGRNKKNSLFSPKKIQNFVKNSEKVLDKWGNRWYHNRARVGRFCACTAMMREIALKNGNFRGVCPVIGRLNCFWKRWRISPGTEEGSASVGHFSWLGMIRTAARTIVVRPYPDTTQTEYVIQGGKQTWQTR